jgi:hypothetical protein
MKTIITWTAAITLTLAALAFAGVPQTINYQGYLKDGTGAPVTAIDPKQPMGFALYSTTGGNTPLWSENQAVKVDKGIYSVALGATVPITLPFDTQYYLGVTVPSDPEMTPRQALTNAPYTFRAKVAEGVSMACQDGGVLIYKSAAWQCGTVTTLPNAAATCVGPATLDASGCTISMCSPGWGDCNKQVPDGCEVDLKTTLANCGACGHNCTAPANMGNACTAGVCATGACMSGYADCNNNLADGCETNLIIDVGNCGACGAACSANNITPACTSGICNGTCNSGFADCNGNKQTDGCETNLGTSTGNCGSCGTACSSNNINPSCTSGVCSGTCNTGFADCNNNKQTDGCETSLNTDINNCGTCGHACDSGQSCQSGTCVGAPGIACTSNGQCATGICVDSVCCSTVCSGTCQACNLAGQVGTCSNIPAGTDPANECADQGAASCGTIGYCNGSGSCAYYPVGTVAVAASCSAGIYTPTSTCSGSGSVVSGGSNVYCPPYTCNGNSACNSTCAGDFDCVSSYYCYSNSCVAKKSSGVTCGSSNQCISGTCNVFGSCN